MKECVDIICYIIGFYFEIHRENNMQDLLFSNPDFFFDSRWVSIFQFPLTFYNIDVFSLTAYITYQKRYYSFSLHTVYEIRNEKLTIRISQRGNLTPVCDIRFFTRFVFNPFPKHARMYLTRDNSSVTQRFK